MDDDDLQSQIDEYEEKEEKKSHGKKMAVGVGVVLVAMVAGIGVGARSCTGTRKKAEALGTHSVVSKFEANPVDLDLAKAAAAEYERLGRKADAEGVMKRHEAAVATSGKGDEARLRAALAADPADDTALGHLVEIYVKRKDQEGARKVYEDHVGTHPTPKRHATFGAWLYRNGQAPQAAKELLLAVKGGIGDPYTKGYLGMALSETGKKREAQRWLDESLEEGSDLDAFRLRSYELDQELGERGAAPVRKPKAKKK